jgi:hypothetical protein
MTIMKTNNNEKALTLRIGLDCNRPFHFVIADLQRGGQTGTLLSANAKCPASATRGHRLGEASRVAPR